MTEAIGPPLAVLDDGRSRLAGDGSRRAFDCVHKVVAHSTELATDDVAEGCEADTEIVLPDVEQEITSPGTCESVNNIDALHSKRCRCNLNVLQ